MRRTTVLFALGFLTLAACSGKELGTDLTAS